MKQSPVMLSEDETDEEEFFDFTDDESEAVEVEEPPQPKEEEVSKPEGRLKRLDNLTLLDSDEPLYVPVTQELVPKTEDQLQDDSDNVVKMGSDSEFITDMMCTTVLSDAEAFKAANPNARFEDFIRWFSPNDWEEYTNEEGDVKKFRLSRRMQAPGNTWQTVWNQAKPVPISKQKRLFDDTQEGYKVLTYLESRNLGEIFALTVVPLLHSAVLKLQNILINCDILELFNDAINEILADLSRFSRDVELVENIYSSKAEKTTLPNYCLQLPNPQPILEKFERLEREFYQYKCFTMMPGVEKLNDTLIQEKFREILRNNNSCSLNQFDESKLFSEVFIKSAFKEDTHHKLINKDYVIRVGEGLESPFKTLDREMLPHTPIMPQFLRAIVKGEQLRLCGAFTEHTSFLD